MDVSNEKFKQFENLKNDIINNARLSRSVPEGNIDLTPTEILDITEAGIDCFKDEVKINKVTQEDGMEYVVVKFPISGEENNPTGFYSPFGQDVGRNRYIDVPYEKIKEYASIRQICDIKFGTPEEYCSRKNYDSTPIEYRIYLTALIEESAPRGLFKPQIEMQIMKKRFYK